MLVEQHGTHRTFLRSTRYYWYYGCASSWNLWYFKNDETGSSKDCICAGTARTARTTRTAGTTGAATAFKPASSIYTTTYI